MASLINWLFFLLFSKNICLLPHPSTVSATSNPNSVKPVETFEMENMLDLRWSETEYRVQFFPLGERFLQLGSDQNLI
jgi:hypothetical protein